MKIKELNMISFGKFNNKSIKLTDGLNIIKGNNESGKSTVSSFLSGMFYGFAKSSIKKRIYSDEYKKYKPWIKEDYRGYLTLSYKGKDYRLERDFNNNELSLIDFTNNEDISKNELIFKFTKIGQPGVLFFDVSREIFENTFFIGQLKTKLESESYELIKKKFENFVLTKDEEFDGRKSLDSLEKQLDVLGKESRSKTIIGSLNSKIKEIRKELPKYEDSIKNCQNIRNEIRDTKESIHLAEEKSKFKDKLSQQMDYNEIIKKKEEISELISGKNNLQAIESTTYERAIELEKSSLSLKTLKENLISKVNRNFEITKDTETDELSKDLYNLRFMNKKLNELNSINYSKEMEFVLRDINLSSKDVNKYLVFTIISTGLSILALIGSLLLKKYYLIIVSAFIFLYAILKYQKYRISKDVVSRLNLKLREYQELSYDKTIEKKEMDDEFKYLFEKYGLSDEITLQAHIETLINEKAAEKYKQDLILKETKNNRVELEKIEKALENVEKEIDKICKEANVEDLEDLKNKFTEGLDLKDAEANIKILENDIKHLANGREIESLNHGINLESIEPIESINIKDLEINLAKLRQSLSLEEKKFRHYMYLKEKERALLDELKAKEGEVEAIKEAMYIISEILNENRKEIFPKLVDKIGEFLSKITADKYRSIIADKDFNIKVYDEDNEMFVDFESLSNGTIDQIYLSFRLAIIDILFKDVPLILDDHFLQYDNERLKNALLYLSDSNRQIIIFTATDREEKILDNLDKDYNLIEME
ncbi:ATP-binding protein [Peptoniphilus catoniae]|uniref:ATP-binding protein n=1 Tax=Peptoniphilus catoniae TaxID=1660341 RepID=UPI0010FD81C0|nr:AAA family ATPase [Peptoniphilus catoniae]